MLQENSYGIIPLKKKEETWFALVIKREKGFWEFPKGHSESGETGKEAAIRELKEETALDVVSFLFGEPLPIHYQFEKEGQVVDKTAHYFVAEVIGEFAPQEGEVSTGEWLPLETAAQRVTFENSKGLCQRVIELLEGLFSL